MYSVLDFTVLIHNIVDIVDSNQKIGIKTYFVIKGFMNFKHRTWKAFAAKPAGRLASWGLPKIPFDRRGVGLFKNIASSGLNFAWPPPPTFLRLDPSIYFNSSSTLWSETWKICIQFQSGKNYIFVGCKNGFFFSGVSEMALNLFLKCLKIKFCPMKMDFILA